MHSNPCTLILMSISHMLKCDLTFSELYLHVFNHINHEKKLNGFCEKKFSSEGKAWEVSLDLGNLLNCLVGFKSLVQDIEEFFKQLGLRSEISELDLEIWQKHRIHHPVVTFSKDLSEGCYCPLHLLTYTLYVLQETWGNFFFLSCGRSWTIF